MTSLAGTVHLAAPDVGTTLLGIAFWTVLLALYVTLFAATLVSVARAPLAKQSRIRWNWLVVLAPGIGILLWFARGRRAQPSDR